MNAPHSRLQKLLDELPTERHPTRNLWPGIVHALQPKPGMRNSRRLALAASVALVVGSSLYTSIRQPIVPLFEPAVDDYLVRLRDDHAQSKQAILVEYQQAEALYPDWQTQLHQLEQAENAIYEALRHDPQNRELLKILRDVQAKQLKLIDAVFTPQLKAI